MAVDVLLVRDGNKLGAADPASLEVIQAMKHGECVTAAIRRQRNAKHHRKWWSLLGLVFPYQKTYATLPDLNDAIKVAIGYFETRTAFGGVPWIKPKSISYAAMDQSSFEHFYERGLDLILTSIVPNIGRADLEAQLNNILEGDSSWRDR